VAISRPANQSTTILVKVERGQHETHAADEARGGEARESIGLRGHEASPGHQGEAAGGEDPVGRISAGQARGNREEQARQHEQSDQRTDFREVEMEFRDQRIGNRSQRLER